MFKFLSSFIFIIVFFGDDFCQDTAQVSIPFLIYDNAGGSKTLYFGLDEAATDTIDVHLGESDLPPFPPAQVFEARWLLPKNNFDGSLSSYRDYRKSPGFPLTDTIEYRLKYQAKLDADTMYFSWNFPPEVTALMQDLITGNLVYVPMIGSGLYKITNFTALNQMKLTVYYNAILSVELTSFNAFVNGQNVTLNWVTSSEINNSGFEIERAWSPSALMSALNWQSIGFIPGKGTTAVIQVYSFSDLNLNPGLYYYRLKQIDFDGTVEHSQIVEADVLTADEISLSRNFPNPFNPGTKIQFALGSMQFVSLKIFDVLGNEIAILVNEELLPGLHNILFTADDGLASGIYYYQLKIGNVPGESFIETRKMILLK
jgi:hypothetical protein